MISRNWRSRGSPHPSNGWEFQGWWKRHLAFSLLGTTDVQQLRPTSDMTHRYPELQGLYVVRLRSLLSFRVEDRLPLELQLHRYFSGELPHGEGILNLLLQTLTDGTTVTDLRHELSGDCNTIPRVSHPWPVRTKNALCMSLDNGTFEDFHLTLTPGPVPTKHPMYFAGAVDRDAASSIRLCKLSNCHLGKLIVDDELPVCPLQHYNQHDTEFSLARSVTRLHSLPHSSCKPVGGPWRITYTPI